MKKARTRVILRQLLALEKLDPKSANLRITRDNLHVTSLGAEGRWQAAIQRNPRAVTDDNSTWHLVTVEADGKLKLSIRFHDHSDHLILFRPGMWENWFGTYDPIDSQEILP